MKSKSFTLVEVLLALSILTIGIVAGLAGVNKGLSSVQIAKSRLIAANLIQEGIEVVRSIRYGNWLEQRDNPELSWDDGLSAGDWEVSYQSQSLESYQGRYLKINTNGFYNYTTGADTKFKRKITIQKINNDQLRVIGKVDWQERGKDYNLTAIEDLYNWMLVEAPSEPPPPPPPVACEGSPDTHWGDNLYDCIGANKRCYNGSCVTCGGYLASDNCSGCADQGENACWYVGNTNTTCDTVCSSRGGCVQANWDDDGFCTILKALIGCPASPSCSGCNLQSFCYGVPAGACSSPLPSSCNQRGGDAIAQSCGAYPFANGRRICVCQY